MSAEKSTIDRFRMPGAAAGLAAAPSPVPGAAASLADPTSPPVPPPVGSPPPPVAATAPAAPLRRARRTGPPAISPLVRLAFGQLERTPAVGGWLAERLWFRLPAPPSAAERERRTPPGGEPFETTWAGGVVRGRVYGDWGLPTAYLVHGWGGWWQQLSAHIQPLVDRGLCVVAFDAPSHGGSDAGRFGGRSTTFVEMGEALAAVAADFGRPAVVVAHSAGAMASLLAIDAGLDVEALALLAPPVSVEPIQRLVATSLGVGPRSERVMRERAERRVGLPMQALDLVDLASRQRSLPRLLVVHDRHDREAPLAGAVELVTAWHGARLLVTDRLGHHRVMWHPDVVARVAGLAGDAAQEVRRSAR